MKHTSVNLGGISYLCFYDIADNGQIIPEKILHMGANMTAHLAGQTVNEIIGLIEDQLLTDMASLRVPASSCAEAR